MARPRTISDAQILQAMRTAVVAHGPKVSLDQVAGTLGVTAPALLKRFGNRDELMLRALKPPEHPPWLQALAEGPSDAPLEEQLLELFVQMSAFMAEVVPCITALRESGIAPDRVYGKLRSPMVAVQSIRDFLERAKKQGLVKTSDTETVAFAILGATQTRAFFAHIIQQKFSERSQRQYLEELASMFTRALTAKPAARSPRHRTH